jgi:hypothetical protein
MSLQTEYRYDVFVSYSQKDQDWVQSDLLPRLEQASIKYIEPETFNPGLPKVDELERAIVESRRTLLILTPRYLEDTWRSFDTTLVSSYGIDTGRWLAIPAVKDKCDLPRRLSALVSVDISQPDDQAWQRLFNAITTAPVLSTIVDQATLFQSTDPNQTRSQAIVNAGLTALLEMMKIAEVQESVRDFQSAFKDACEQIEVLAVYKGLHDQLHHLQVECYRNIMQEAKRFPDDETACMNLVEYDSTLQRIVDESQAIISRAPYANSEKLWIKDIAEGRAQILEALDKSNAKALQKAVWLLGRVLAIHPSQINTRLNEAARALHLPALVNAMALVREKLDNVDQSNVEQFEASIDELANLNYALKILVSDHDNWQAIDLELGRIKSSISSDLMELEMSWPHLKEMAEPLYSNRTEDWAVLMNKDANNLEKAIAAQDQRKTKESFQLFFKRSSDRFMAIDKALLRLCESLRQIGQPLAFVLRIIK